MIEPGRKFVQGAKKYRYGFNGMELDNEVKGEGNSYDFGARILDVRLGRWLSVDPLAKEYSSFTPYCFSINSPLIFKDYDGRDIIVVTSNGTFTLAKETLLKTPTGKEIWDKFSKSKTEDVYIAVGAFTGGGGITHYEAGRTKLLKREIVSNGKKKIVTDSKFYMDPKDEKFAYLSIFNGVDVSKSQKLKKKIHIVVLAEQYFTEDLEKRKALAQGYNSNGKEDLSIEPIINLADIIFHELKVHIDMKIMINGKISTGDQDHQSWGKDNMGAFRSDSYKARDNSPAAEFQKELQKVYDDMKAEEKSKQPSADKNTESIEH